MMTVAQKIRALRTSLNETQLDFSLRFGVEQATVSRWEKGSPVRRKYQAQIADLAGMSIAEFFYSDWPPRLIRIVGQVSTGDSFSLETKSPGGNAIQHFRLDLGAADQIAVRVSGENMSPAYRHGDIIIGHMLKKSEIGKAVGKDCIVKTADGIGHVKRVLVGSKRGLYRLRSYNVAFEDIEDVKIEWAAPIIWVGRGG